ncbi:MAG: DUF4159 domain-containing protein [Aureliella sp.]
MPRRIALCFLPVVCCLLLAAKPMIAQIQGWGRGGRQSRRIPDRSSFPTWEINEGFESDAFTFVRIQFDSNGPFGWHDRWDNDYPDGDWNFSLRLQQLTSMQVDPNGRVLRLTDPDLMDYPFAYFAGVQYMVFDQREVESFRTYLENGGFFMMDDLWGVESLDNVMQQMKRVLPGCEPRELTLDHELFQLIYPLEELPQVTDYLTWSRGARYEYAHEGDSGDQKPHFIAYYDSKDRMVGVVCHNNDIGDGWEREGHHKDYFRLYSLKHSYPFGINLITYALTH